MSQAGPGPAGPCKIGRAHRLNSSHMSISYAVFCLKKKKKKTKKNIKEKKKKKKRTKKKQQLYLISFCSFLILFLFITYLLLFSLFFFFFFFNDTATTEIYTLSLHDALPISSPAGTSSPVMPSWTSSPR